MSDTTALWVGDRVRVKPTAFRSGHEGELIGVEPGIYTHTIRFTNGGVHTYKACELERIDDEPAMPAGVARSPNDHTGGAGPEAEPAAQEPPVEKAEGLEAKVATLEDGEFSSDFLDLEEYCRRTGMSYAKAVQDARTDRLMLPVVRQGRRYLVSRRAYEALLDASPELVEAVNRRLQKSVNHDLPQTSHLPFEPALGIVHTTTRRMRVNVTKTTRGYSYDTTFEITSDDPAIDLQEEMEAGLGLADRAARQEICNRQYTDEEGLPGADDDKPF